MKVKTLKGLKIKLKGPEADSFKSTIRKLYDNQKAIGFKMLDLTEEELKTIKTLNQKLNP